MILIMSYVCYFLGFYLILKLSEEPESHIPLPMHGAQWDI